MADRMRSLMSVFTRQNLELKLFTFVLHQRLNRRLLRYIESGKPQVLILAAFLISTSELFLRNESIRNSFISICTKTDTSKTVS